eukprot:43704-Eustigmatos_ZCMA.PRE.1
MGSLSGMQSYTRVASSGPPVALLSSDIGLDLQTGHALPALVRVHQHISPKLPIAPADTLKHHGPIRH